MEISAGDVFAFLTALVLLLIGLYMKNISSDIKSLEQSLAHHKTHVAEEYMRVEEGRSRISEIKDDMHRELSDIKTMVGRLFEKVDKLLDMGKK